MEYRTLGSDLTVSAIGLGCMGMSHAYGAPADKTEMTKLLAEAVDMGYTLFDTAEVYGTPENPHDNEELVGIALKPYRNRIVLATKFGIHFDTKSTQVNKPLVPDSRPDPSVPIEDVADVKLTAQEVRALDDALNAMEMSEVFCGTKVVVK